MSKWKFRNAPLYLLFIVNCIYTISHHAYNWLFTVSALLTGAVLVIDIAEAVKNGRKK